MIARISLILIAVLGGVARAGSLQILYPLYSYPNWYSPTTYIWGYVAAAGKTAPITAIINPDNGPDGPPNADFLHGMSDLKAGGVAMVGYVPTGNGNTPLSTVEKNIDTYEQYYTASGVSGIFLDEASTDPAKLGYYTTLYNYIKAEAGLTQVITNPGTQIPEAFVSTPASDTTVIYEDTAGWPAYVPDSYVANYPARRFASLILNVPTVAQMEADIALAEQRNIGYVYVTDRTTPNPYNALPSYWTQEVNDIGGVPGPATTLIAAKGEAPGGTGGTLTSAGPPAINAAGNVAFHVTVTGSSGIGLVTNGTYGGIAYTGAAAPDMTGAGTVGVFARLSDPVLNNNNAVAFAGALMTGGGVGAADDAGIWSNADGTMKLVARKGAIAPGSGGTFSAFSQIVLPDTGGVVFRATLAGVPAAENQGVWVTGSNGITPVVITGQQLVYSNNELKTVKAIGIFQQPAIVQGQSRSFSAGTGNLVYEATFTDGTWGIYEVNLP